jgi:hypothetical protein
MPLRPGAPDHPGPLTRMFVTAAAVTYRLQRLGSLEWNLAQCRLGVVNEAHVSVRLVMTPQMLHTY